MDEESTIILQQLMSWRTTISAAAYVILRDVHRAEDVFQSVVLKALHGQVRFASEAALMSWALVSARRASAASSVAWRTAMMSQPSSRRRDLMP